VSLKGPNIYPTSGLWFGVSRELNPDVPLTPVITHPIEEKERMTKAELAARIDWEGGVMEAVEYGVKVGDLPVNTPEEVLDAWQQLQEAVPCFDVIYRWLELE
jgi:hypothetical protein